MTPGIPGRGSTREIPSRRPGQCERAGAEETPVIFLGRSLQLDGEIWAVGPGFRRSA